MDALHAAPFPPGRIALGGKLAGSATAMTHGMDSRLAPLPDGHNTFCLKEERISLCHPINCVDVFALLLQLPPFRNSDQPLGHTAGTIPSSPLRCIPSFSSREKSSILFPLQPVSNCSYTCYCTVGAFCGQILHNTKIPFGGTRTR